MMRPLATILTLLPLASFAMTEPQGPSDPVLLRCEMKAGKPSCTDQSAVLDGVSGPVGASRWRDGSVLIFGGQGTLREWREASLRKLPSVAGAAEIRAAWTAPDGTHQWVGDAEGAVFHLNADGTSREVIRLHSGVTGKRRPVTSGWVSQTGAMWITAGDTAHALQWSADGSLRETGALVDVMANGSEVSLVGVGGVDDGPSHWSAAFVDDAGRMLLVDSDFPLSARTEFPAPVTNWKGKPDIHGEDQLYRGLHSMPDGSGEFWASAWYGRLRRVLLSGEQPVVKQCGAGRHGCLVEPSLLAVNDLVDPKTKKHAPVRTQLSFSSTNSVTKAADGTLWVVGDDGFVAARDADGSWARAASAASPHVRLNAVWPGAQGAWVLGQEICRGRNGRPKDGVAHLLDFHRPQDPDHTAAFQCAIRSLCPRQTGAPCGGVVDVPTGTFKIHETLVIDNEIQIVGRGESSVIEWRGEGLNEFGGLKTAVDLRGRPRGACPGPDCRRDMIFPPAPDDYSNVTYVRSASGLRNLTLRSGNRGCSTGTDTRARAIGVDFHAGYEGLSSSAHTNMISDVTLCGFEAGVRLAGTALDGSIRRLRAVNNHVGLAIEDANQWNVEDVDAEGNDLGILLNEGQIYFHAVRLVGNRTGGLLVTRGFPVIDGVTARDNPGFDIGVISGRRLAQKEVVDLDAGRQEQVEPLFRQAARRLDITLSNLALLGGANGTPGRLLLVSPIGDGSRCGVARLTLRNVAGPNPPVLDVLDECPSSTELSLENAPVTLRRMAGTGARAKDVGPSVTSSLGAYGWAAWRTPKRAGGTLGAIPDGPAIELTEDGRVTVGGTVMPEAARRKRTDEPPAQMTITAPAAYPATMELWAAGDAGALLHVDGTAWTRSDWGGTADLKSIWSSPQEAWIVGAGGVLLRMQAEAPFVLWTSDENRKAGGDTLPSTNLNSAWGADPKHVWAVGDEGVILRWDGTAWRRVNSGTTRSLKAISGFVRAKGRSCEIELWAVGSQDTVLRAVEACDAKGTSTFAPAPFAVPSGPRDLVAVSAPDDRDVLIASEGGRMLLANPDAKAGKWTVAEIGSASALGQDTPESIWGINTQDGTDAFVLAGVANGDVLHYDPRSRSAGYVAELPSLPHPVIWGASPADLWVASTDAAQAGTLAHWDGRSWTVAPLPVGRLRALTGPSTNASMAALENTPTALDLVGPNASFELTTSAGSAVIAAAVKDLTFSFRLTGAPPHESLRITSEGRVGIGTATPDARLDVQGDASVSGAVSAAPVLMPQTEAKCEPGSTGRLIMQGSGLVICGADGKPRPISR